MADSKRAVADIFNSAIAAAAIATAWETGFLDELREQKKVDVNKFSIQNDLDSGSMQGLVTALATVDVVKQDQGTARAGTLLDEAYRAKSLFHWLALGSGGLFSRMQYVLRNENRTGKFYQRDPVALSYACKDINREHFDPAFWQAMEGLDYKFHSIVDLGSGSGERLMQVLERYPGTVGLGVDIASASLKVAAAEAKKRGFRDRLSFVVGDVRALDYRDEFANVDLLTCFMMGHDFWPRESCVSSLQRLVKTFPKARRFFLGDTTRILLNTDNTPSKYAVNEDNVPIFTLGFEFGHALMGVYIPTIEEWEGVFAEGGWRCVKTHLIKSQSLSVLFELEPVTINAP
ncbi:methyltransferase MppJ [Delitschia confertaspora ATCC 74209]|uniref:Methyltransferase MppJ n=1 Tax=Delitschia confertaspora ATCC 74209 TaxID=1513339 RepID=A0A9P4JH27_9PLEO|nr:methyltransferase MppJ [Delitschia confertaspora ATCC 74209]